MHSIGLVFDSSQAFTRGVLRGIEQYAHRRPDWALIFHDTHGLTSDVLQTMAPAGLIAHVVNQELVDVLRAQQRPVVNTSFMLPDAPFPRVGADNVEIGRQAYRHLQERGFSHFGLVGHLGHFYSDERESGFRHEMNDQFVSYSAFYRGHDNHSSAPSAPLEASTELQKWLLKLPRPVGILTCRGVWGVQVIEACRMAGLQVPDDVGVVCVDDDDLLCELSRPSLTSIVVPSERIGFEAAAQLDELLKVQPPTLAKQKAPIPELREERSGDGAYTVRLVPPVRFIVRQSSDIYAGGDAELKAAMRFILNHAHEGIHVEDVLKCVGAPRRILEQKFRNSLQRGIGEEIRRVRLERVKSLLANSDLSISEIAEMSGFTSVYYLSRAFRQQMGETPTSFRRSRRGLA